MEKRPSDLIIKMINQFGIYKRESNIGLFVLQLLMASIIAVCGFLTNSTAVIIGSMLLSPIGGFILDLVKKCLVMKENENIQSLPFLFLKLFLLIAIPIVVGVVAELIDWAGKNETDDKNKYQVFLEGHAKQSQLKNRAEGSNFSFYFYSAIIAISAGFLFGITDGGGLIGIGIGTALLPPLVAFGMYIVKICIVDNYKENNDNSTQQQQQVALKEKEENNIRTYWGRPFILFWINFICIFVFSLIANLILIIIYKNAQGKSYEVNYKTKEKNVIKDITDKYQFRINNTFQKKKQTDKPNKSKN